MGAIIVTNDRQHKIVITKGTRFKQVSRKNGTDSVLTTYHYWKWLAVMAVCEFLYLSIYSLVLTIWVVTIVLPENIKYFLENASICIPTIYDDEYFL